MHDPILCVLKMFFKGMSHVKKCYIAAMKFWISMLLESNKAMAVDAVSKRTLQPLHSDSTDFRKCPFGSCLQVIAGRLVL